MGKKQIDYIKITKSLRCGLWDAQSAPQPKGCGLWRHFDIRNYNILDRLLSHNLGGYER